MSNSIALPFPYFADPNRGRPIFNGQIFVGQPDTDPEIPLNQIPVSYIDNNGNSVALTQPISTNSGGYPVNSNGDVVSPQVGQSYSLKVLDRTGSQAFYSPVVVDRIGQSQNEIIGGSIYSGSDGMAVANGDTVPSGTTHLRVLVGGVSTIVSMSPVSNGVVSLLSETGATIGGVSVSFKNAIQTRFNSVQEMLGANTAIGFTYQTGLGLWTKVATSSPEVITNFEPVGEIYLVDFDITPEPSVLDNTPKIQSVLNAFPFYNVISTKGIYMIDAVSGGVDIVSGTRLIFEEGAEYHAIPNSADRYAVLRLNDPTDVKIINPNIKGDRDDHTGTSGEFGHGIDIWGATDWEIINPKIRDMWGDGIYIGQKNLTTGSPRNGRIIKPRCSNCRRQGISLIASDGLYMEDVILEDINGTSPQSGMDIEPNNADGLLRNIVINKIKTARCAGPGITNNFNRLTLSDNPEPISITINDFVDEGSSVNLVVERCNKKMPGYYNINGMTGRDAKFNGIKVRQWNPDGPRLTISDPVLINPNSNEVSSQSDGSAIGLFVLSSDDTQLLGNVEIKNPQIQRDAALGGTDLWYHISAPTAKTIEKLSITGIPTFTNPNGQFRSSAVLTSINQETCQLINYPSVSDGVWTPMAGSSTFESAFFTKSGNMVTVTARMLVDSMSSDTGPVEISGLPFSPSFAVNPNVWVASIGSDAGFDIDGFISRGDGVALVKNDGTDVTYQELLGKYVSFTLNYRQPNPFYE